MKNYDRIISKAFQTAAESRDDFTRLFNERAYIDSVVRMAFLRHSKALDTLRALGGVALAEEFSRWYMEEWQG